MDKQFIKKVRLIDRIATRIITVGGLLVIASVIAILLLIFNVALPLFMPAKARLIATNSLQLAAPAFPLAVGIDDYHETAYVLDNTGCFTFFRVADGSLIQRIAVNEQPNAVIKSLDFHKNSNYTILWNNASASLAKVSFRPDFDQAGKRTIVPAVDILERFPPAAAGPLVAATQIRRSDEGRVTRLDYLTDQRFAIHHKISTTDIFDNVSTEESDLTIANEIPGRITAFTLNEKGTALFAGTDIGNLLRWDLSVNDSVSRTDNIATEEEKPITVLGFVLGDISVAVADAAGNLTTWMPIRTESQGNIKKYRPIHQLATHRQPVVQIIQSRRNKSIMSLDAGGTVFLDHMTSENHLLTLAGDLALIGAADRGNSLIGIDRNNRYRVWNIDNPHPEVNLRTLFGKIWYENYDQPEYVWQSSAGSDDFEPKLSIVPLLFGTIKGTFYAMFFAIPLAIFGAVYTSQFTSGAFKKTIKPGIEIMASIPSVVIGFLIALWLAPIVEKAILAILLSLIIVPVVFIGFLYLYKPLYNNNSIRQLSRGYEFLLLVPVIFLAGTIAVILAPVLENLLFDGNFKFWLYNDLGMRYDQRNCIIIAFGLGIAVIPIIFSITEDAITNIPPSLSAASLALGASRWQTVWRVILPSASPGIFAAIMIGFGRAVGETMIVLMATGNTPIMDWSIFNGMRTLSANIAVEIPEAPLGGTLYRVLFLCSTLLFVLTFILNTGADIVRERLRKKYGRY